MTHRSLFAIPLAIPLAVAFCLSACSRSGTSVSPDGTWAGAIEAQGATLRLEIRIKSKASGDLSAELVSIDQGNQGIPVDSITVQDGTMTFSIVQIAGSYRGTLNQSGDAAIGTWSQLGNELPLTLKKQD